jgi:molybdopterin-guanine dinucleotide biosynthesis protein A
MRGAVVLAGGRSRRFAGGDKSLAEFEGDPLVGRVVDRLDPIVDDLVVSCRSAQVPTLRDALGAASDVRFAPDPVTDRGPVAGMAAGLRTVDAPVTAVVACDLPALDTGFVRSLFGDLEGGDADAVVPVFEDRRQPLCAVYRSAPARRACDGVLDSGEDRDGSLRAVLDRLEAATIPESTVRRRTGPTTFRDVDTRGDLVALATETPATAPGGESP